MNSHYIGTGSALILSSITLCTFTVNWPDLKNDGLHCLYLIGAIFTTIGVALFTFGLTKVIIKSIKNS